MNERGYPCALHEQRLQEMERTMNELTKSTQRLERIAERAMGGGAVLMLLQPIAIALALKFLEVVGGHP